MTRFVATNKSKMEVLTAYFIIFIKEPEIEQSFSKHLMLLEAILKKSKDKELLKACLWGRQMLKYKTLDQRAGLCYEFRNQHLVVKIMTFILTSFISLETIVEAYAEVKAEYGEFPAEVFKIHNQFLTKLLYEKVLLH